MDAFTLNTPTAYDYSYYIQGHWMIIYIIAAILAVNSQDVGDSLLYLHVIVIMRAKKKQELAREAYAKTISFSQQHQFCCIVSKGNHCESTALLVDRWSFSNSKCTISKAVKSSGGTSGLATIWGFELCLQLVKEWLEDKDDKIAHLPICIFAAVRIP